MFTATTIHIIRDTCSETNHAESSCVAPNPCGPVMADSSGRKRGGEAQNRASKKKYYKNPVRIVRLCRQGRLAWGLRERSARELAPGAAAMVNPAPVPITPAACRAHGRMAFRWEVGAS